jgi:hypothetical protein
MISLGRTTAAKTFTRFNNKSVEPRNSRQATTLRIATRPSGVAVLKGALGVLCASLLFAPSALAGFGLQPGVAGFEFGAFNQDGSHDLQAGSHPYELVTRFDLNTTTNSFGEVVADGDLRDVAVELPPGLIGNATVLPQCSPESFLADNEIRDFNQSSCPSSTAVGVVAVNFGALRYVSLYNLVPPPGVPAEFGFAVTGIPTVLVPSVRTGSDYGLTVEAKNISQELRIEGVKTTFWGVPGDPSHDSVRGICLDEYTGESRGESCPSGGSQTPLLSLPTSCAGSLDARIHIDSWQDPGRQDSFGRPDLSDPAWRTATSETADGSGNPLQLDGCNQLAFPPLLTAKPDTSTADTPAGLTAEVTVPQDGLVDAGGLAPADVKNTTVTLPEGVVVNPGQAAGLVACQAGESGVGSESATSCPLASKVGTDEIRTPLLRDPLEGDVFVLQSNPPNLQLLIGASADGVNVKLVADVHLDEATGRLTTTLTETPPLPFTRFRLSFSGGAQAALATPTTCGLKTSSADFTPWSSPLEADAQLSSSFAITTGPDGSGVAGCTGPLPFTPSLIAGATTDQAGGFTSFSLLLQNGDGQQRIGSLQFKIPQGLSGMLSTVPLCGEPQANAGTCGEASQIGHATVASGPGPYPLVIPQPGAPPARVYLTGPYEGAPFGLSIVTPVIAGPFNLGTNVVRARIDVDPHTAQITVTTDASGPHAIPQVLDGVPTDLRTINTVIDRPGFMFNPTNCSPQSFAGTATSAQGTNAPISTHFQVGSCQSLKFAPKFAVSTSGRTSKALGASLTADLSYPRAAQGTQANITRVKVDLPKQLPSRLTTLQKACTNAQFEANPANCPAASKIGSATVTTPLLPVALTGPVIFVSHGGEAFPSLTIVLQGDGVTVDLVGTTFISKKGITSTTFKTVPDVPFNAFTLTLPEGKFSALAANGNLCRSKLAMPTEFLAQNGLKINASTKISVSGCAKQKTKKAAAKRKGVSVSRRAGVSPVAGPWAPRILVIN